MEDKDENGQASQLFDIVLGYVDSEQWDAAEQAVDQMDPRMDVWKIDALNIIASRQLRVGSLPRAQAMLSQSEELARLVKNEVSRAGLLYDTATLLASAKLPDRAKELWIEAANDAQNAQSHVGTQDKDDCSKILRAIAVDFAKTGDRLTALKIADSIQMESYRESARSAVEGNI